ncbi:putative papain-like cysteine peptidase superfamily [Helianthus annuus]|nr:putative papain-like cysteine peptidase superfamily [Helianthus annuus]
MSDKKKRGAAKCKKMFLDPNNQTVEFNEAGLAIGANASKFISFACLEFRTRIPYYKLVKDIDEQKYVDVWEYIKETWKIPNDNAKETVIQQGKDSMRNFRCTLTNGYARKDKSPFEMYAFMDISHWVDFVLKVKSKAFKETSQKAKKSVAKNTDRPHVGRMGFVGLQKFEEDRWNQLLESHPHLHNLEGEDIQRYAISRACYNSVTKLYELPAHLFSNGELTGTLHDMYYKEIEKKKDRTHDKHGNDVVTINLHSRKKKKKSKGAQIVRKEIGAIQKDQDRVAAAAQASLIIRLPKIKSISTCDLLWPFDDSFPDMILGHGQVYPTSVRILDKRPIHDDYVQVHVDDVNQEYKGYPVPPHTMIENEVINMGSTHRKFIQWPRKAIKLLNTITPRKSIAQHQQPAQQSEYYTPAPYDEGLVTFQEELNIGTGFVDLLTNSILIQPTHTEHVSDPKASKFVSDPKARETLPCSKSTEHVSDPKASKPVSDPKALETLPCSKSTEHVSDPKASKPVSDPKARETLPCPKSTDHVSDPKASKVVPNLKASKAESDPKATDDVSDPKVVRIAAILKMAESRPKKIYGFAEQLATLSTKKISVKVTSPSGMYKDDFTEDVEIEETMTLCVNGLLELSVLHWYSMYLYAYGGFKGRDKTAYFNPRMIHFDVCDKYENFVIDHIKDVMDHHKERHYFMAPHLAWGHWSLSVIFHNPSNLKFYGYIIDSKKKGKSPESYIIAKLFEKATGENIIWQMVNCPQQKGGWECGYYVMKAMYDIVISCQEKIILHSKDPLTKQQIDNFVEDTLKNFMITLGSE